MKSLAWVRSLRTGLPRSVTILQAGLVLNALGNGAAGPFLLLYLHNVRGISLGLAGLAAGTSAVCALLSALVAGAIADRHGSRATMIGGLLCSTTAFALYPLVRLPWHAFVVTGLGGIGIGTWLTMQSSLLAAITPPELRAAAFARQRVAANVGLGLGGFIGGLIVTTSQPESFTRLFLANGVTFLVYCAFLARVPVPERPKRAVAEQRGAGYRDVIGDGAFVRFAALNFAFVVGCISLLNGLFPVFAKNEAHVSEQTIGLFFLLNSSLIIAFQLPIARAVEGRRRMRGFALMGALFALCWLLVFAGGEVAGAAVLLLAAGITAMSIGECLYDSIQGPLASDLAPAKLVGRYMAVMGFSWQLGFLVGPASGGFILAANATALWPVMACVCAGGGLYALLLEQRLPEAVRKTPRRTPQLPEEQLVELPAEV